LKPVHTGLVYYKTVQLTGILNQYFWTGLSGPDHLIAGPFESQTQKVSESWPLECRIVRLLDVCILYHVQSTFNLKRLFAGLIFLDSIFLQGLINRLFYLAPFFRGEGIRKVALKGWSVYLSPIGNTGYYNKLSQRTGTEMKNCFYHLIHLFSSTEPEWCLTPVWMTLVNKMAPFPFPFTRGNTRVEICCCCCWQDRPPMDMSEPLLSSRLESFSSIIWCSTCLSARCWSFSWLESVGEDGLDDGDELDEHLEGVAPDLKKNKTG
jgi:hypothetical protein